MDTKERITEQINSSPVVLYMKGSPQFPQCGFSSLAVEILKRCNVNVKKMTTVDVLMDVDVRQGIKEYSEWPTVPQLYIKGEFIGGADIMREMYDSGELAQIIPPEAVSE